MKFFAAACLVVAVSVNSVSATAAAVEALVRSFANGQCASTGVATTNAIGTQINCGPSNTFFVSEIAGAVAALDRTRPTGCTGNLKALGCQKKGTGFGRHQANFLCNSAAGRLNIHINCKDDPKPAPAKPAPAKPAPPAGGAGPSGSKPAPAPAPAKPAPKPAPAPAPAKPAPKPAPAPAKAPAAKAPVAKAPKAKAPKAKKGKGRK
ncbi:hypothetical protein HDU97_007502 [Phlyctochytrium planicorne]|nr:hypothetical protein HDU97_007502 [Phlyctochytrium planicorne]